MIVYFDRNVLNHVRHGKRGASQDDKEKLRQAVRRGKVEPLLSIVTLSETLIMGDIDGALEEIQWIVSFTRQKRVVKDALILINESIRAYASQKSPPTPYTTTLDLSRVLPPNYRDRQDLLRVANQYLQQRTDSARGWMHGLDLMRREMRSAKPEPSFDEYQKETPSFRRFWKDIGPPWVESLAKRAGVLDKCQARGISG